MIHVVRPDPVSVFLREQDEKTSAQLVGAAREGELTDAQVAELARGLAASGIQLPRDSESADLASTGGPASLSTLLCPLFLRGRGFRVPKLGVPGRPAGGVDVLQTIPGFNAALDPGAASAALAHTGYVHLLADDRWAPLDRQLFAYRQQSGGQALPALVIASILAKKLAAGTVGAGLEARVAAYSNFGRDRPTARVNARRYKTVAGLLGMSPVAFLTNASQPYQPYVGRGEALMALEDVVAGRAVGWLAEHVALCAAMADAVATALGADTSRPVKPEALRRAHQDMLAAQGTDFSAFSERVAAVRFAPRTTTTARSDGYVEYDLARIRDLLVARQRHAWEGGVTVPDPAGVILWARPGVHVERGVPLISVRVPDGEARLADALADCAVASVRVGPRAGRDNGFEVV